MVNDIAAKRNKRLRMQPSLKGARFPYLLRNSLLPRTMFGHRGLAMNRHGGG